MPCSITLGPSALGAAGEGTTWSVRPALPHRALLWLRLKKETATGTQAMTGPPVLQVSRGPGSVPSSL